MIPFSPKTLIRKELSNIVSWKTKRRIVVFESDDWGSIRMPSLSSFEQLEKSGLDLRSADAERYNLNDSLATSKDLEGLFDVLSGAKDRNGNHAVFTPVSIVANPDFRKISESGFSKYYYEAFTDTLKRFAGCEDSYSLWKEGIEKKLFVPQMHGREHLNVRMWMKALQEGDKQTTAAFREGVWGFVPSNYPEVDYQAAFLLSDTHDLDFQRSIIIDGLKLFKQIMGYEAEFFVPPNGMFNNSLNETLAENGIKYRYVSKIQNEPQGLGRTRKILHYPGQKERNGIRYMIRNCFFEPSQAEKDWVDLCLNEIQTAFRWNQPAIIGSHRVNYIGALNPGNRDRGLSQLSSLLNKIQSKWPEVEFLTTPQLGKLMNSGK